MPIASAVTTNRRVSDRTAGSLFRTAPASVRRARWAVGLLALLASLALLPPAPAQALAVVDLVSNYNERYAPFTQRTVGKAAQSFTTGAEAQGYILTEVKLRAIDLFASAVAIREDNGGPTGNLVARLTGGGTSSACGQRLLFGDAGAGPGTASGTGLPSIPADGPDGPSWPSWSDDPSGDVERTMSARELLMGTSFRAVLGSGAGAQWTGWGQGASVSAFSSAGPNLSLSGETATGSMGMDFERGGLLAGFAMTHSAGRGTAQGAGRSYVMGSAVTTMLPYARFALSESVSAWGLAGTGAGRLTLDLDGGPSERYGADLAMTLAAMGVRGELVAPAQGASGFALALEADAFWVRTESDSVSTPGVGNLAGARAEASRLRAVLDGSRTFSLSGGATLTPSLELGLRHDGGDAETGTGLELGAGLGYAGAGGRSTIRPRTSDIERIGSPTGYRAVTAGYQASVAPGSC